MNIAQVSPGNAVPDVVNVVIEIASNSTPVKYELDKVTGALTVDRFLTTSMHYPCNYGFIPCSLAEDGDPADVLVVTPYPVLPGTVVACRPIGMLKMADESGEDAKILAVPISKITKLYDQIYEARDIGKELLAAIEHFFVHYKDLEANKWVKVDKWENIAAAKAEIMISLERYIAHKS